MFKYNSNIINIEIDSCGLYGFSLDSATGKTYLSELLRICGSDINANGLTYKIFADSSEYSSFEESFHRLEDGTLVILDRLDFFFKPEWVEEIQEASSKFYILMDFKRHPLNCIIDKYVKSTIHEKGVNVYG